MKNLILSFVIFVTGAVIYAQDLYIPDNPYDKAPEQYKQSKAFNRERWFYEQRMYPFNFLPQDAYSKAMAQREEMLRNNLLYSLSLPWTSLGPTPGYYFHHNNISGRTTTIKYHPTNPNIIYLGGAYGGVWKSTNGGVTWVQKTDFEASLSSGSIAIDPTNPNIIYYGTGEATYSGVSYYGRGLLKSTNGGDNWVNYTTGLPSLTYFAKLAIRPNFPNQLLAALGTSGLYRSTDAGVSWVQILSGRCDDVVFSPDGNNAYIVGSGTGYRISTDGGVTFTTNTSVTMSTRNHIAISRSSPNILYIVVYTGSNPTMVYKSTNSGINYPQSAGIPQTQWGWYDLYIHVNPFDPNFAYVGLMELWRTTDGGVSFHNIATSSSNVHVDHHNADFHPTNPNVMLSANDGGVNQSTDRGTTWTNLNTNLSMTQFYRIASDPSNANHIIGGTQDNGTQRTTGTINWNASFGGDGGEVCFHSQNPQYILGETQNNGIYRSTNGGVSWSSSTSGLTGTGAWIGPIITHPSTAGVFYTARQQVFISTNWGANWSALPSSGISGTIRELAISRTTPSIIYATVGSTIYKTTDGGSTFTNVTSGLPTRTITSVAVHPDSANVAVITYSGFGAGKIYKTTNGAGSWFNISGNLPDSPTNDALIYYPGISTSIYIVGMDIGVFITTNFGNNWSVLGTGLPNTVAMSLDYHRGSNKVRIGTHGRGVWETSIIVGIISYKNEIPESYALHQNYPNPFNQFTIINFDLPMPSDVKLIVYDALGREVSTLVNQQLEGGIYKVMFDAAGLASGVYYYQLVINNERIVNEYRVSKRMVLMK